MQKREVVLKVFRFNPEIDNQPYYDYFNIAIDRGVTLLRALMYIKNSLDSRLTFRAFCRAGICGSCGVRLNGRPILACKTQLWDEFDAYQTDELQVDPLENFDIIRDLVVNLDSLESRLKAMNNWLVPKEGVHSIQAETRILPAELDKFNFTTSCILCNLCMSACSVVPVDETYIGPLFLARTFRFVADKREAEISEKTELALKNGLWSCTHCNACLNACPTQTKPLKAIVKLRKEVVEENADQSMGARRVHQYASDIYRYGQVNKTMLSFHVDFPKKSIKQFFSGWRKILATEWFLLKHGKFLPPFPKTVAGIRRARRLMSIGKTKQF